VIDYEAGKRCTSSERRLTWNQTGPQGPAGPQGAPGTTTTYVLTKDYPGIALPDDTFSLKMTLPRGLYRFDVTVTFEGGGQDGVVGCRLMTREAAEGGQRKVTAATTSRLTTVHIDYTDWVNNVIDQAPPNLSCSFTPGVADASLTINDYQIVATQLDEATTLPLHVEPY
jgi:hypothetical protein